MALSKQTKIALVLLSPIIVTVLTLLLLYRLPISKSKIVVAEVRYQMLEFGFDDYIRYRFEWLMGNRRIYLLNEDVAYLYVSGEDYKKLWPVSPFHRGNTTTAGKFVFRKLLSGRYSVSTLADTLVLHKRPYISK